MTRKEKKKRKSGTYYRYSDGIFVRILYTIYIYYIYDYQRLKRVGIYVYIYLPRGVYAYVYINIYIEAYVYLNRCTCTDPIVDEMCQTKIRFIVCYGVTFIYIYLYRGFT